MNRTDVLVALMVFAALVAGCGRESHPAPATVSKSAPDSRDRSAQASDAQRQFITVEPVAVAQAVDRLAVPGRVTFRPQAQAAVGPAVAGRVMAVLVQPGQVVKAGAPLLTIDSADAAAARAALDQANTRLATAQSVLKRQVEMMDKGVGLEMERQEAEARLKEARAEQERAQHAADLIGNGKGMRVVVRAPEHGVVMTIRATVGAIVAPGGEALIELGDPNRLQVVAQVAESDLRHILMGEQAEVEFPGLDTRVAARVESFNPRVDAEMRRIQVYLVLGGPVAGLRAGMMAQVTLRAHAETAISIPVSAVLIKGGTRRVVYLARSDGRFEARDVQTGRSRDGQVTILKGLSAGERIVVKGALLLDAQAEQLL